MTAAAERIDAAVAAVDFGRPGYRRRGRNPRFPFAETTLSEWGYRSGSRRPLVPVAAVRITPMDPRLPTTSYPAAFTAIVRRVQP